MHNLLISNHSLHYPACNPVSTPSAFSEKIAKFQLISPKSRFVLKMSNQRFIKDVSKKRKWGTLYSVTHHVYIPARVVIAMHSQEYLLFGKPIERPEKPFCEKCLELLKDGRYSLCYNCNKVKDDLYFEIIRAPAIYKSKKRGENHLSRFIRCFKYSPMPDNRRQRIAEEFTNLLLSYCKDEAEIVSGVDCLVPVPMTKEEEIEKGFNHIKMITEKFAEEIKIKAENDNLIKIKKTERQTNLKKNERRENIRDAFDVKNPSAFEGKTVLLIDDVVTTYSTVDECAKTLKKAGAHKVNILALARNTTRLGDSYDK